MSKRILALVELNRSGQEVIKEAARLAYKEGAKLALAHIADWGLGLDDDHYTFMTPAETLAKVKQIVEDKLKEMAGGLDCQVFSHSSLEELILAWQPDLLLATPASKLQDGTIITAQSEFSQAWALVKIITVKKIGLGLEWKDLAIKKPSPLT